MTGTRTAREATWLSAWRTFGELTRQPTDSVGMSRWERDPMLCHRRLPIRGSAGRRTYRSPAGPKPRQRRGHQWAERAGIRTSALRTPIFGRWSNPR